MRNVARALALAALAASFAPAVHAQTTTAEENGRSVHAFMSAVDLSEVQASALAAERAANAEVRAYAAAMVAGHAGALHAREAQVAEEGEGLFEGVVHVPAAGGANGNGAAAAHAFTAEQVQAIQTALEAHPASRALAQANAANFRVLQGVTGPQFDATYMDAQIGAHQYALQQIDRMMAQEGLGDDITQVMRGMRTAVATHLQQAQQIRARLQ
jgi:predicted outer membrane protein